MSTPVTPAPAPSVGHRWVVELKVIAATLAATAAGVGVEILNEVQADHSLLGPVPAWAQGLILVLVPPAATFLAGWKAKHTPRPDLTPAVVPPTAPPAA